jgi:hypothetical protein
MVSNWTHVHMIIVTGNDLSNGIKSWGTYIFLLQGFKMAVPTIVFEGANPDFTKKHHKNAI